MRGAALREHPAGLARDSIADAEKQIKFFWRRASRPVKSSRMAQSSKSWQLSFPAALAVWAFIVAAAVYEGARRGFHGQAFFIALGVAAALFGFELFLAVPSMLAAAQHALAGRAAYLFALVPLFAVVIYSLSVTGSAKRLLFGDGLRSSSRAFARWQRRKIRGQVGRLRRGFCSSLYRPSSRCRRACFIACSPIRRR